MYVWIHDKFVYRQNFPEKYLNIITFPGKLTADCVAPWSSSRPYVQMV